MLFHPRFVDVIRGINEAHPVRNCVALPTQGYQVIREVRAAERAFPNVMDLQAARFGAHRALVTVAFIHQAARGVWDTVSVFFVGRVIIEAFRHRGAVSFFSGFADCFSLSVRHDPFRPFRRLSRRDHGNTRSQGREAPKGSLDSCGTMGERERQVSYVCSILCRSQARSCVAFPSGFSTALRSQ